MWEGEKKPVRSKKMTVAEDWERGEKKVLGEKLRKPGGRISDVSR